MAEQQKSFWSSLPGILTGIAAVITALTGLYLAVNGNSSGSPKKAEPASTVKVETPKSPAAEVIAVKPEVVPRSAIQTVEKKPFPESGPLVDCSLFPTVNSVASLMGWSNHYHQQIIAAGDNLRSAAAACNQTIDYRGMAHCKDQHNPQVREALLETLQLCRSVGVEWEEIQHSTILGKE